MFSPDGLEIDELRTSIDNHIGNAYRHMVDGHTDLANTALLFAITEMYFVHTKLAKSRGNSCDCGMSRSLTGSGPLASAIRSLRRSWRWITHTLCAWPAQSLR